MLPSQDSVMLPTPRHHELSLDDDVTDPIPTAETSNKVRVFVLISYIFKITTSISNTRDIKTFFTETITFDYYN